MRVYLDLGCLKRPFDDQSQPRIHLESEAVLALLGAPAEKLEWLRCPAHDLENDQNPVLWRASRVRGWLQSLPLRQPPQSPLASRTKELMSLGFGNFDAFHLASAEMSGADVFSSCDQRLLAAAARQAGRLKVRVSNPGDLAEEVFP